MCIKEETRYTELELYFASPSDKEDLLHVKINLKNVANIDALIEDLRDFKEYYEEQAKSS